MKKTYNRVWSAKEQILEGVRWYGVSVLPQDWCTMTPAAKKKSVATERMVKAMEIAMEMATAQVSQSSGQLADDVRMLGRTLYFDYDSRKWAIEEKRGDVDSG